VWGITFADLRYRYRQFLIAVIGAGLVLAMALLMAGLAGGFSTEIDRTVSGVGAQSWVLSDNAHGSIAGAQVFPQSDAALIAHSPGVTQAAPLVIVLQQVLRIGTATKNTATKNVEVFGVQVGGLGDPAVTAGKPLSGSGQVVVDVGAGVGPGTEVTVGAMPLRVVGQVTGRTMLAGVPIIYLPLADAQALAFGGRPLITAVVTRGVPASVPAGLAVSSNAQIEQSVLNNLAGAIATLTNAKAIMWLVAAVIVGALLYVSALQRVRDFAVIKALGSSSLALFGSLALQAVVIALLAAAFGMIICNFMVGLFKQPIAIPGSAFATLPLIAVVVGLVASLAALRRVTGADPATAFSG
jgi:putative ABC transport system permease protein